MWANVAKALNCIIAMVDQIRESHGDAPEAEPSEVAPTEATPPLCPSKPQLPSLCFIFLGISPIFCVVGIRLSIRFGGTEAWQSDACGATSGHRRRVLAFRQREGHPWDRSRSPTAGRGSAVCRLFAPYRASCFFYLLFLPSSKLLFYRAL